MNTSPIPLAILTLCQQQKVIARSLDAEQLTIAALAPVSARDQLLAFNTQRQIIVQSITEVELQTALQQQAGQINAQSNSEPEVAVSQYIQTLLEKAIELRASDIHLEPQANHYQIRLRIDGILQPLNLVSQPAKRQLAARIKILASLNIAEQRLPQDGQLQLTYQQQSYTLRVATLPIQHGEKLVLRILNLHQQQLTLQHLGLQPEQQQHLLQALNQPQGLILVTGPTGSGKTITLYSALSYLNQPQRNLCSIEDPIEIPLPGINQTQVNPKIGLTFATTLRALLRQDPEIIMVGEIRDQETATIVNQAAQTGHLVLSTLHTNSCCETLIRLQQMGIANHLLAASIKLIIAQRLLRKLCPHCKQPAKQPLLLPTIVDKPFQHWQAVGCDACIGGYQQRIAIFELLLLDEAIQQLLLQSPTLSLAALNKLTKQQGQLSLYQAGIQLVMNGQTSYDELHRVLEHWSQEDVLTC